MWHRRPADECHVRPGRDPKRYDHLNVPTPEGLSEKDLKRLRSLARAASRPISRPTLVRAMGGIAIEVNGSPERMKAWAANPSFQGRWSTSSWITEYLAWEAVNDGGDGLRSAIPIWGLLLFANIGRRTTVNAEELCLELDKLVRLEAK